MMKNRQDNQHDYNELNDYFNKVKYEDNITSYFKSVNKTDEAPPSFEVISNNAALLASYDLIGLTPTATTAEISAKCTELAKNIHIDAGFDSSNKMLKLKQAYELIINHRNTTENKSQKNEKTACLETTSCNTTKSDDFLLKNDIKPNSLTNKDDKIGLKWFYFYILAYVPISLIGSLGYISAKKQALVELGYTREIIDVIYKGHDLYQYVIYAFTVFAIVVVCGLYFRKLWAWNCNWILLTFLVISYDPSSKMESMIYIVIFKIIFIFIPNYFYWMKRKPMFS